MATWRSLFVVACAVLVTPVWIAAGQDAGAIASDHCGVISVAALARLLGKPLTVDEAAGHFRLSAAAVSLGDVRSALASCGIVAEGQRASLDELREDGRLAILHLRRPDHFLVLVGLGTRYALVHDQGRMAVWEKAELARRYSGVSLVAALPGANDQGRFHMAEPVLEMAQSNDAQKAPVAEFGIRNIGKGTLTLTIAGSSCSCLDASLLDHPIAPGRGGRLRLALRNDSRWGDVLETVSLRTSDPMRPHAAVGILWHGARNVRISPDRLAIRTRQGREAVRSLAVSVLEPGILRRCFFPSGALAATFEVERQEAKARVYRVQVRLGSEARVGTFADELVIELEGAEQHSVRIPVEGVVESRVAAKPRQVLLGLLPRGTTARREVEISADAGASVVLRKVQAMDPRIAVSFKEGVSSAKQVVEARVVATGEPGALIDGDVVVTLGDGGTVSFGVFGMIAGGKDLSSGGGTAE